MSVLGMAARLLRALGFARETQQAAHSTEDGRNRREAMAVLRKAGLLGEAFRPILDRGVESAWVRYTTALCGTSARPRGVFSRQDIDVLAPYVRPLKARYYEFLGSLLGIEHKEALDELLYRGVGDITNFRQRLALPTVSPTDDFYANRIAEYRLLFGKAPEPVEKSSLMERFELRKDNAGQLFQAIDEQHPFYFARKMLLPTFQDLGRIQALMGDAIASGKLRVLDYGCGAADTSLFLATYGNAVTLCDVGGMLEKAAHRFALRGLPVECIPARSDEPIPAFVGQWDVIIAVEVIEHVFDPFALLERMDHACSPQGRILLGSFPFADTNAYGDHLSSAVQKRGELLQWIENRWERIPAVAGNAFRKRHQ